MAHPETKAAQRLARAIASDLSIYNQDKIKKGLEDDNIFELLEEEIEEGRTLFRNKFSPEIVNSNIFERAIIDIIVAPRTNVKTRIF